MTRRISFCCILLIFVVSNILAKDISSRQYFFTVKKIFPGTNNVNVFIQSSELEGMRDEIAFAATQAQLKVKIYSISDFKTIGASLRDLEKSSTLVIYPSAILTEKSSRLFILKKCKEKEIAVISSSQEYSDSGALLGILAKQGQKTKLVLNLKHSEFLSSVFTPDYAKQVGISEVIR